MASPDNGDGLTFRDILLEVRADVRSIRMELENKADRARVHELANEIHLVKLEHASDRRDIAVLPDHETRLRGLERFRYAIPSIAVLGLLTAAVSTVAVFIH